MIELTNHHDGLGLTELCRVFAVDEPHPINGAHHRYKLYRELRTETERACADIGELDVVHLREYPTEFGHARGNVDFQRGPRDVTCSTPGTLDGALLSILIHRYECFQDGPFACPENAEVLRMLNEALDYMKARAYERAARGVLGKNER